MDINLSLTQNSKTLHFFGSPSLLSGTSQTQSILYLWNRNLRKSSQLNGILTGITFSAQLSILLCSGA